MACATILSMIATGTTAHSSLPGCSRRAALCIAATSSTIGAPLLVAASPPVQGVGAALPTSRRAAALNSRLQQSVLHDHAARFDSESSPAAIAYILYAGTTIRSLVATINLPPDTRVAVYPVEVVSDEEDHDNTYAVGILREIPSSTSDVDRRGDRSSVQVEFHATSHAYMRACRGIRMHACTHMHTQVEFDASSGVPTRRSLARAYVDGLPTIAMFANEPDARHTPNCALSFPTTTAMRIGLGDIYCAYLQTTRRVCKGDALTLCYGDSYIDRGYPTSCTAPVQDV